MTYKIIDNQTIQIDKYVIKILKRIGHVDNSEGAITEIYDIQLFENNKEIYIDKVCLKITKRRINLDNDIVDIVNANDNFIKILYFDKDANILTNDFLGFKKDTKVYFMIMEKIDSTLYHLCNNLERENFHLSADMLNYFTYTIINSINYLLQYNLYYFDLKPLNIGYKIINNQFIIKIIDIDSIEHLYNYSKFTSTPYTSPFYFNSYYDDFNYPQAQFNVILFTIFQLIFNDQSYNSCKDYYRHLQTIFTNQFIDPQVNYSISCSNLKTILTAFINKLITNDNNCKDQECFKSFEAFYRNYFSIESDIKLNEYLLKLFYIAYKFKKDNQPIDTSIFSNNIITADNAFELGNSNVVGSEIIAKIINYINSRSGYDTSIQYTNEYISIKTFLNPTMVENITIKYREKIGDNKYIVDLDDYINQHSLRLYMNVVQIDDNTINFIKSKKYFNNIIFSIKLNKISILNTEYNNVYLILSRKLLNENKTSINFNKIIKNIINIANDLYNNNYYYDFDINDIYIKHNKIQIIDYTKLKYYTPETSFNQTMNIFVLIIDIIDKYVNQTQDFSNPNDEIITKLANSFLINFDKINKLNYIIRNDTELSKTLNKMYSDIFN